VLFFALTGAAQLFELHEPRGNYQPAAIVEKLSAVHKNQVFAFGDHHAPAGPGIDTAKSEVDSAPKEGEVENDRLSTLLLKGFFLLVALCLSVSTALGVWMGLTQLSHKPIAWLLMAAGALVPTGLLIL